MKGVRESVKEKENAVGNNIKVEQNGMEKLGLETKDWKALYYEMLALKNEADNDLRQMMQLHADSEAKMATLLEAHGIPFAASKPTSNNEELRKTKEALQFYEVITGMTVESVGDKKFQCTIKHENQPADTTFIIGESGDEMTYEITGNGDVLPEYMQSNLSFDKSLTPVILADALHALFVEEEEEA